MAPVEDLSCMTTQLAGAPFGLMNAVQRLQNGEHCAHLHSCVPIGIFSEPKRTFHSYPAAAKLVVKQFPLGIQTFSD